MIDIQGVRGKWVYDSATQKLVEKVPAVIVSSAPAVHQDTINPTWHPATGETFDSKSAFRRVTKEKGYVEIDDKRTWDMVGKHQNRKLDGLKDDIEEIKAWYTAAMKGNKDYINANVPQELRDCEEVDPNDITEGLRR
jgi:hypothetical protein